VEFPFLTRSIDERGNEPHEETIMKTTKPNHEPAPHNRSTHNGQRPSTPAHAASSTLTPQAARRLRRHLKFARRYDDRYRTFTLRPAHAAGIDTTSLHLLKLVAAAS
jgi:hypothetical protein